MLAALVACAAVLASPRAEAEELARSQTQPPARQAPPGERSAQPRSGVRQPPTQAPARPIEPQRPEAPAADEFQFGSFLDANPAAPLASVPEMFGDSFYRGGNLTLTNMPTLALSATLTSDLPLAGGARRVLAAEHNKALPVDRVYFNYNHFHNALESAAAGFGGAAALPGGRDFSINRYLLGWERTFSCGCWSAELRFPLAGHYAFDAISPGGTEAAFASGGEVGNLAVLLKGVVYNDGCTVVSAGLGFDLPIGDDAEAAALTAVSSTRFSLENEAVYLLPYLAAMGRPDMSRFWHAFVQLDVPLAPHGYRFETAGILPPTSIAGDWEDQTLLHLDLGGGYWLYRSACTCSSGITGVAAIVELHYTTPLDETDVESATIATATTTFAFDLRNAANRTDVINLTTGLHFELAHCTTLRLAAALPLREADNRWFDAEVLAQLARRF